MRGLPQLPKEYFEKFAGKSVSVKPFNPKSIEIALEYIKRLNTLLTDFNIEIVHRGSTAFGIAGKGDIEIGIYPKETDWKKVLNKLAKEFGGVNNLEENYARFNDDFRDYEIEIIMMKGNDAKVDKALTKYLKAHTEVLKKYEKLKYKYAYSKKEYMIEKDKFLRNIIEKLT